MYYSQKSEKLNRLLNFFLIHHGIDLEKKQHS